MMIETSETIAELATALAQAQGEFTPIPRTHTADIKPRDKPSYSYKYADLADTLEMSSPVLAKHGLSVVQLPYSTEGGLGVITRLMHSSGEWVQGNLSHDVDMKKPQEMGALITYLRRYAYAPAVGIVTEDDTDAPDLKTKRQSKARRAPEPEPEPEPTWAEKSQKIAEAVKSAATSEAVTQVLKVFSGDLQWLHDHKPHYYERLMEVAKEREDELHNVSELAV